MSKANYIFLTLLNPALGGAAKPHLTERKLFFSRTYEQRELVVLNPCEMAALRPLREAKDFTGLKIS